ncbi:unnamed protein product, partial [Adineta steineri]
MSILLADGRSAPARRPSHTGSISSVCQIQWSPSITIRHGSISGMGRRRALDLYGTKDVVFSHEQVKRAKRSHDSTTGITVSG